MGTQAITLRGVRVHNLKNLDVEIPLHRLTVVTGVCGAGKSSLVFDTLYAEAQRRYLQSFSAYTRQFLERFEQPHAEEIGPLPPAIAIRRAPVAAGASVASLADITEPLRLLFTRAGTVVCPICSVVVTPQDTKDIVLTIESMPSGTVGAIAFLQYAVEPAEQPHQWAALLEQGYVRIHVGGTTYRLDSGPPPVLVPRQIVWVILDRFEVGKTASERLTESIDSAFQRGDGHVAVIVDSKELEFDQRYVCPKCRDELTAPTPRLFDYNDPLGACPVCFGAGAQGRPRTACAACNGHRWNREARAVRIGGRSIADWCETPVEALLAFLDTLDLPESAAIPQREVRARLGGLTSLDLGYLTLGQHASTLSDGALRRVVLASAVASNLVNVLYLIDEPSLGMHPRDSNKLIVALLELRDRGNTVVVIEHERSVLAAADHVIDLGPGAGEEGGQVVYQGSPDELISAPESPTSDFWTGRDFIETPTERRKPSGLLKLSGVTIHNLQQLSVEFPLGVLCVVTGPSGAGKRSLIEHTLFPALTHAKKKTGVPELTQAKVTGASQIADVVLLDQTPSARSSRSNPATYVKIFDDIRELFAQNVDAKIRNLGPGQFSFNQAGGRCETCEGQGTLSIAMQFIADVTATCPECHGRRYRKEILDIKVRSLNIAEVLELTVREAFRFFRAQPGIEKKLKGLIDVGLDYLRLGQSLDTLAGGENQRLKLAAHLASSKKGACLFILIDPSAGLHPLDVTNLLECFDRLLSAGHSLIVIDNDADLVRCADHVIDMNDGKPSEPEA